MAEKEITVALAGNPNCGKTTLFNSLTGSRQHVGNWPGKTVERKEGSLNYQGYNIKVVDLPGVYSLTAYSLDEVITRNYIVDEHPDVVVDIVDASNLERNLYLSVQLLEMGAKVVIGLNMMDMARSRKYQINVEVLSRLFGIPVVPLVASRNQGIEELKQTIIDTVEGKSLTKVLHLKYGREVEEEISKLEKIIASDDSLSQEYSPRWLAVKLIEEDAEVIGKFEGVKVG